MCGERGGVCSWQPAERTGDPEHRQRQQESEREHAADLGERDAAAVATELDATLQADCKQQDRADELVDRRREAQLGPRQSGQQAEHEKQHHGIERIHSVTIGQGLRQVTQARC